MGPKVESKKSKKGIASKKDRKASKKGRKRSPSKYKSRDIFADLPVYSAENVYDALHEMGSAESPINLSSLHLKKIKMPSIQWVNYDRKPNAMKLQNCGYSVVLSGLWPEMQNPYVCGGPFMDSYVFYQLHFHWGQNNEVGSEHTIEGMTYPFEMHAVFYKKSCGTSERAKLEPDGIIIFAYMFKVQQIDNEQLDPIIESIEAVIPAHGETSVEPIALNSLIKNVTEDYILYLGIMKYKCKFGVLWLICRETVGISDSQDKYGNPIPKPFRDVQDLKNRNVFFVSPTPHFASLVLHPLVDQPFSRLVRKSRSLSRKPKSKKSQASAKLAKNRSRTKSKAPKKKKSGGK